MTLLLLAWILQPIWLKVSPRVAFAPSNLLVQAHLLPIASDRRVRIEIESEDFYAATECQLEGEDSPKVCPVTRPLLLQRLGPGSYEIRAGIGPWSGFRAVTHQTVEIQGNQ